MIGRPALPVVFALGLLLLSAGCAEENSTEPDGIPPDRILDLRATSSTANTITLEWTAVGDDGTTGRAAAYDLRYSSAAIDSSLWVDATQADGEPVPHAAGETETFALSGLEPGRTWHIALKVADDVPNWSGLSNVAVFPTLPADAIPPAPITDLAIVSTTEEAITIGWTSVGDDGMVGQPALYEIRWSASPIGADDWDRLADSVRVPAQPPGTPVTHEVHGLLAGGEYYLAVKALDDVGLWGALSNVVSALAVDLTPPAPVVDLVVTMPESPAELVLTWTAPADDGGDEAAALYDIRYAPEPIRDATWEAAFTVPDVPVPRRPGEQESVSIVDLDIDRYYFAIKVRDEAGNWSPLSNVAVGVVPLRLEAENYSDSLNVGGNPILRVNCTGASGQKAADGVDLDGDWIRIPFDLLETVCFTDSLRSAADLGVVRTFAIEYVRVPDETVAASDSVTTIPGAGIG